MQEANKIIKDISNKIFKPVYFLHGDEPYYIDMVSDYIEKNILSESEKSFNQICLYGKDSDVYKIIELCRKFPMMSNYQVVIIKEAQDLNNIENLDIYIKNPLKSTILVINYKYKKLDKRKNKTKSFNEALATNGVSLNTEKIRDYKIPDWIDEYVKSKKYKINQKATILLSEYLGNDLYRITNEIEKLIIAIGQDKNEITIDDIAKNTGISKEYNIFELQNALVRKDILKANQIIDYHIKNPKNNPAILTLTSLYFFFTKTLMYHQVKGKSDNVIASEIKISPYFVKDYSKASKVFSEKKIIDILSDIRVYNMKSLGVENASTKSEELLRELIFKILH